MLDHIGPKNWAPGEAVGAPDHPHRGFETISYVLEGRKVHRDSAGHSGHLGPGDVQWMTAGSGIVHSELPEPAFKASGGRSHGFQIWVNLPARLKMTEPRYQDVPNAQIPTARSEDGLIGVKVIAGRALGRNANIDTMTPVTFLHFTISSGASIDQPIERGHNAMVYVFAGTVTVGVDDTPVGEGQLCMLGDGDTVRLGNRSEGSPAHGECLLLAGLPLSEPVARMGPFVMNTREEIVRAVADYQAGRMGVID
jgi:redox-sensitive bicupin YhaK (pirin superfamily)